MNHRENALKLRIVKLETQNAALKLTFDRMLADIEMTESVGCAFAWDLASSYSSLAFVAAEETCEQFQEALKAGEAFQEARKWLRDQMRGDKEFRKTAIEAANKDLEMELETPFGRFSLRTLSAT